MSFQGFELPDELRLLAETVGEFGRREIWPVEGRTPGQARPLAPEAIETLRKKARDAGFWCLDAPERFGGGGLTVFQSVVVGEQMAKHRYSIPRPGAGAPRRPVPGHPRAGRALRPAYHRERVAVVHRRQRADRRIGPSPRDPHH